MVSETKRLGVWLLVSLVAVSVVALVLSLSAIETAKAAAFPVIGWAAACGLTLKRRGHSPPPT